MPLELRVPISRLDVRLHTDDGATQEVTLFLPPGQDVDHLFGAGEPFVPLSEQGRVRLYARASIAAIAVRRGPEPRPTRPEDEFLTERRALIVRLRGGAVIEGTLRHGPVAGKSRTADLLNEPTASFALEGADVLYRIAKAHVACVDEA